MEVSGQLHAGFTPGKKVVGTQVTGGWVGPKAGLDVLERRKTHCPCQASGTEFLRHPACSLAIKLTKLAKICQVRHFPFHQ
jgi:hypothetical protein